MTHLSRRRFLLASALAPAAAAAPGPPSAYGALPSARQVRWHEMETYAFLHFTVNTFTDREWGNGDEDPNVFNPTAFDADAIILTLKAGGMTGAILTCKHHDGFCLWPTKTTEHSVRGSSWRGGKGDVVKDLAEAARRHGLKFGVYLSPWDRNNAQYGKPEYIAVYREQLRELLTGYGPIFEVWHDGANGGDGYYGGAREKRVIDKRTYYDWPKTWDLTHSLQPDAVIFSDVGPDIRWVGNERGFAGDTCWETYDPVGQGGGAASPGDVKASQSGTGTRNGAKWLPPECDVSIRPGWFWHERENERVKTPAQLLNLYYRSVGRGGSLLLNVPPDRRGLLHENDVKALREFGGLVGSTFAQNLAAKAKVTASQVRGKSKSFDPRNLLDGDRYSYWSSDDGVTTADVVFDMGHHVTFNVIRLRENIRLGQRVDAFAVDEGKDGGWSPVAEATSIGACRLIRTEKDVTTSRVRLRITQAAACPAISEFGLFREGQA
ncbi:MAG TPA: alpha-L-fucosidase [Bryobacteraceae bacterium]|nr:alpha-L-fucosidase [Bryobacteraceae bacterium]